MYYFMITIFKAAKAPEVITILLDMQTFEDEQLMMKRKIESFIG